MAYRPSLDYPPNWNRIRYVIFERDNYICQKCGRRTWRPHCHHIKAVKLGGTHHPDNLVTLCGLCHDEVHESYLRKKYQQYMDYNDI